MTTTEPKGTTLFTKIQEGFRYMARRENQAPTSITLSRSDCETLVWELCDHPFLARIDGDTALRSLFCCSNGLFVPVTCDEQAESGKITCTWGKIEHDFQPVQTISVGTSSSTTIRVFC